MCIRDRLNVGYSSAGTVSALEIFSIFNTNSKYMARTAHLISERSLHRQLPRLRTACRSQEKPSILVACTERDVEAQSSVSSHHKALSALVCLTRFVLVFVQHGVSTIFPRVSPPELTYFKAGPVHGKFCRRHRRN